MIPFNMGFLEGNTLPTPEGTITPLDSNVTFDATLASYSSSFLAPNDYVVNFWAGPSFDGYARLFHVNDSSGVVTPSGSSIEFDVNNGRENSAFLIDDTHCMNFWEGGAGVDGTCQMFDLDTVSPSISAKGSPLVFEAVTAEDNSAFLVDSTTCMNFWTSDADDGKCRMFDLDVSTGVVTPLGSIVNFDVVSGSPVSSSSAFKISSTKVVNFWSHGATGKYQMFDVDTATGAITPLGSIQNFTAATGQGISAFLISPTRCACFWSGSGTDGFCQIFELNVSGPTYMTALSSPVEFDTTQSTFNSAFLLRAGIMVNFWVRNGDGICRAFSFNEVSGLITPLVSDVTYYSTSSVSYPTAVKVNDNLCTNFWNNASLEGICRAFEVA